MGISSRLRYHGEANTSKSHHHRWSVCYLRKQRMPKAAAASLFRSAFSSAFTLPLPLRPQYFRRVAAESASLIGLTSQDMMLTDTRISLIRCKLRVLVEADPTSPMLYSLERGRSNCLLGFFSPTPNTTHNSSFPSFLRGCADAPSCRRQTAAVPTSIR
jgi:hypothetical protein